MKQPCRPAGGVSVDGQGDLNGFRSAVNAAPIDAWLGDEGQPQSCRSSDSPWKGLVVVVEIIVVMPLPIFPIPHPRISACSGIPVKALVPIIGELITTERRPVAVSQATPKCGGQARDSRPGDSSHPQRTGMIRSHTEGDRSSGMENGKPEPGKHENALIRGGVIWTVPGPAGTVFDFRCHLWALPWRKTGFRNGAGPFPALLSFALIPAGLHLIVARISQLAPGTHRAVSH